MVAAVAVGMPDFNGGTGQGLGGIEAIIDMAGNFDGHAGQIGEIQVAVLQFRHAGHMIGTFRGLNGEAAGLFFGCRELARLEWLCQDKLRHRQGPRLKHLHPESRVFQFSLLIFLGCLRIRRLYNTFPSEKWLLEWVLLAVLIICG